MGYAPKLNFLRENWKCGKVFTQTTHIFLQYPAWNFAPTQEDPAMSCGWLSGLCELGIVLVDCTELS